MSKAENMVPYCARMPRGLLEQAKAAARAEGMGLSELVRFLLREYVRREVPAVRDEDKAAGDALGDCGIDAQGLGACGAH